MVLRASWKARSKCRKLTPKQADKIFFIDSGGKANKARTFCKSCPVKQDCLNYAILYKEWGIWAGTTEEERKSLDMIRDMLLQDAVANMTLETRNFRDWLSIELGEEIGEVVALIDAISDNVIDDDILDIETIDALINDPTLFSDPFFDDSKSP
ncbi:MAG TPA: WhiB family transcriptional regulator [Patescibacteria group bacterium]|nr:WhiB family transcriptional regulator [Patescibacteria group bacterium]